MGKKTGAVSFLERVRRYAKHLEIVEYVRFDTGKPRPCRRRIVRFNGKRDVLVLYKYRPVLFQVRGGTLLCYGEKNGGGIVP